MSLDNFYKLLQMGHPYATAMVEELNTVDAESTGTNVTLIEFREMFQL
jgi:hypothetical protein